MWVAAHVVLYSGNLNTYVDLGRSMTVGQLKVSKTKEIYFLATSDIFLFNRDVFFLPAV